MSVSELFNQLSLHTANNDYKQVYTLGASLASKPAAQFDPSLFQQCVVAIIQNDQYALARKLIHALSQGASSGGALPPHFLVFEKLYIDYKLNENEAFEETFQQISLDDVQSGLLKRALLHLKAQQFYKLGYYNNALEIYKMLLRDGAAYRHFDDLDILINERAIGSQRKLFAAELRKKHPGEESTSAPADNYDFLFNESLIEANERQFAKALGLLSKAQSTAESYHSAEGSSHLEVFLEVAPMYLQSAYIYQLLNDTAKALGLLQQFSSKFGKILHSQNPAEQKDKNVQLFKLIYLNNYYSILFGNQSKSGSAIVQDSAEDKASLANAHSVLDRLQYPQALSSLNNSNKLLKSQYYLLKKNESILNFKIGKRVSVTSDLNYDTSSSSTEFKRVFNTKVIDDNENYDLTILALASLQESNLVALQDLNVDDELKFKHKLPRAFHKHLLMKASTFKGSSVTQAKKLVAGAVLAIQLLVNASTETNLNSHLNSGIQLLEKLLSIPLIEEILLHKLFGIVTLLINLYDLVYSQTKYLAKFQQLFNLVFKTYHSADRTIEISNKYQYNFLKKISFDFFNVNEINHDAALKKENSDKITKIFEKLLSFNPHDQLILILVSKISSDGNDAGLIPVEELTRDIDFSVVTTSGLDEVLREYTSSSSSLQTGTGSKFVKKSKRVRKKPQHANKQALADPTKPVDQERWMPLRDRTYYKVSKKDKKKLKTTTQGSVSKPRGK